MFGAIKHTTLTLPTPAENLACDEALLDASENGGENSGVLRFWESPEYFVVVGYGNKVAEEVNQAACVKMNVPVLRRCSGGGTVVQGPGCLNYSLILPFDETGPLRTITGANQFIMERNRDAIQSAIGDLASTISVLGHTDLALTTGHSSHVTSLKFSGNAQRRRRSFLLFHGTFLLNFDLFLLENLLHMPTKEPDYRGHRAHSEFVTNLHVTSEAIKKSMQSAWEAKGALKEIPQEQITALVREKYSMAEWHLKI